MFILKSTHDKIVESEVAKVWTKAQADRKIDQRALDAERSVTGSLGADIEAMRADYELGRHVRTMRKAQDERRKAERAAKRAGV